MRLTRRGWTVLVVVIAAVASGVFFGARGLNAVAAPGVVALAAAVVQVRRIRAPVVERELPRRAHRGTTVPVRLDFDVERPFSARVHDEVDAGLVPEGNEHETTVRGRTLEYEVELLERGERSIGPTTIEARDVLGLVAEQFRYAKRDRILVLPRIYLLGGPGREDLVRLYGGTGDDRQEFDHLRHYQRGDPLRDVHWKSSAKQPDDDLVVKEFTTDEGSKTIEIAAESRGANGNEMADAAASIAADLLEAGVNVGLTTPADRITPDSGPGQRRRILDHLATARSGLVAARARSRADIVVEATDDGVTVDLDGVPRTFAEMVGDSVDGMVGGGRVEVAAT